MEGVAMTEALLRKIPQAWQEPDADGDMLANSFKVGMLLEVSVKGKQCRVYQPEDVNIPFDCLEYVGGDDHPDFLRSNEERTPTR